ncbi:hypothetical protein WNY37_16475 [Henriciella sp. AS95]|uniref:hypothetical protein n=1 Tax=Henriciella sp. AS95 TaxID=3135782 RepID=UPI0031722151
MAASWIKRLLAARDVTRIGCIDFGTAYSKVSIVDSEKLVDLDEQCIHPLAIGEGQSHNPYLLPSLLFVDENAVRFGRKAETSARRNERRGRVPFASPKQYLSTHALDALEDRLPAEIDPTGQYTAKQLITLYLAYLLRRAEQAAGTQNLSWPPLFRVTRPAWKADRAAWGETMLRELVRHAFILLDHFGEALISEDGLEHDAVKAAFAAIPDTSEFPDEQIFEISEQGTATVPEATAVAAASIRPTRRRVVVVADIGGGTSDFAAFTTGVSGRNVVAEIDGSATVLREAGDYLDMQLRRILMYKAGLLPDDPAARGAISMIRSQQRELKETLFAQGKVVTEAGDQLIELSLEEFLSDQHVRGFSRRLAEKFYEALTPAMDWARNIAASGGGQQVVEILPTGGGSTLPMVADMIRGIPYEWTFEVMSPELFQSRNTDFTTVAPQLAVSIGGAVLELPRQVTPVRAA